MTIVRKKRGITNKNKSTFQNGGSMKGSAPISAPKQDYSAGQLRRGATAAAKRLKTGAIGVAKVTGGIIAAPFALASAGIGLGVGAIRSAPKALLTTGKTALKSVKLGAQTYLAGRSRKKLREKLGVAYPESVTALANFAARKKSINNAHKRHMEHLSKHAPTLSTRTWYGKSLITKKKDGTLNTSKQEANTAKKQKEYERQAQMYQTEKDKQTETLLGKMSNFHRKKALGGETTYKTSRWGRSKRGEVSGHTDLLSTKKNNSESMDDYFAKKLAQSQTNLSTSYEAGKERLSSKIEANTKTRNTQSNNLLTKSTTTKQEFEQAKNYLTEKQEDVAIAKTELYSARENRYRASKEYDTAVKLGTDTNEIARLRKIFDDSHDMVMEKAKEADNQEALLLESQTKFRQTEIAAINAKKIYQNAAKTNPKIKYDSAKLASNTAKKAYDAAKLDYDASVKNFTGTGPDYASEGKKIILNRYLDEYKAAEKKALEAEQELQKATPKDISHYESKYYQRLQNVENTKSSIKKNWTKFGQTLKNKVRSSTFVIGNTLYGKKNNNSKIQSTTLATPLTGSDYGLRTRLGLGEFGISPFTSTLEKSDKIKQILYDNTKPQKQISQLTSEISELTTQIEKLKAQIAAPIDSTVTPPVDKNALIQELQKSQANLQTLSADKLTRQNLLSRAKITILKLKDEANYYKNIKKLNSLEAEDKAKYSELLTKIEEKKNTNIIPELDTQIQILAKEYKRKTGDEAVKVLRELQIMKQLKRYYNAELTQSKIDAELK